MLKAMARVLYRRGGSKGEWGDGGGWETGVDTIVRRRGWGGGDGGGAVPERWRLKIAKSTDGPECPWIPLGGIPSCTCPGFLPKKELKEELTNGGDRQTLILLLFIRGKAILGAAIIERGGGGGGGRKGSNLFGCCCWLTFLPAILESTLACRSLSHAAVLTSCTPSCVSLLILCSSTPALSASFSIDNRSSSLRIKKQINNKTPKDDQQNENTSYRIKLDFKKKKR